jgi:hypothetical protein
LVTALPARLAVMTVNHPLTRSTRRCRASEQKKLIISATSITASHTGANDERWGQAEITCSSSGKMM